MTMHSRDTNCPSYEFRHTLVETEGAGKAGCRSHPWSACNKKHAAEPQVRAEQPAFPARWFTTYFALSPGTGVLAPVCDNALRALRRMSAPGHQDHTTWPSAAVPLVSRHRRVHRIPHSTFVTIAIRPRYRGGTCGKIVLICPTRQGRQDATW